MTFTLPPFRHRQEFLSEDRVTETSYSAVFDQRPFKKFVMHEEEKLIGYTGTQNRSLFFLTQDDTLLFSGPKC